MGVRNEKFLNDLIKDIFTYSPEVELGKRKL